MDIQYLKCDEMNCNAKNYLSVRIRYKTVLLSLTVLCKCVQMLCKNALIAQP